MVVNIGMKTAISQLTQLGLSEYEAKAYTALLKENPASAYEIAKNSGIPTSKIYEVIKRLESKQMVQSIRGERVRMFIPQSSDEFIGAFRKAIEDNLIAIRTELNSFKRGIETSYSWHINEYDNLIPKAKRIIDTAEKTLLLSIWPPEIEAISIPLVEAVSRGIKVAIVHHGTPNLRVRIGQLYRHPVEDTIYTQRGERGFSLVADSKEAIIARISRQDIEGIWSMNEGFVIMAEDYIRHDIFILKIISRFDPLLKERFGEKYEGLRDIYKD